MKKASLASVVILTVGSFLGAVAPACGSSSHGVGGGDGGGASSSSGASSGSSNGVNFSSSGSSSGASSGASSGGPCTGLQCQIDLNCGASVNNGHNTSISGYVYDPAGNNPLYNVVVYVPNAAVDPLPAAPAGDCSCSSLFSGSPVAAGVTDATGHFIIPNAPDNGTSGTAIPLVVQIGKWRKQTSITTVKQCTDNTDGITKLTLPSQADANDDLPQIAISTGGADTLECLLHRIGVADGEWSGGPGGTGHIHIFQGSTVAGELPTAAVASTGTTPASYSSLFADMSPYDIVVLSCEGGETAGAAGGAGNSPLTTTELTALQNYTTAGGRAFLSHFHYAWLTAGPFSSATPPLATFIHGSNPIYEGAVDLGINETNGAIIQTQSDGGVFQKGAIFDQWLTTTHALTNGALPILAPRYNSVVGPANTSSQEWIAADSEATTQFSDGGVASVPGAAQYFTFDTPLGGIGTDDGGATEYCGRVVFSDLHVGSASGDYPGATTTSPAPTAPTQCANNALSPQEKALEFMLFDLSSCVTPDTGPGSGGSPPVIIQ
jgi:hypothetical protein